MCPRFQLFLAHRRFGKPTNTPSVIVCRSDDAMPAILPGAHRSQRTRRFWCASIGHPMALFRYWCAICEEAKGHPQNPPGAEKGWFPVCISCAHRPRQRGFLLAGLHRCPCIIGFQNYHWSVPILLCPMAKGFCPCAWECLLQQAQFRNMRCNVGV